VGPRTGLDDVERRKILPLTVVELGPLGRPARSQTLYRLRYPGSFSEGYIAPIFRLACSLHRGGYLLVLFLGVKNFALSKGCHLDVVRGPSNPHDPESDAGGSLSSWQGHPSQ
jgi:hypothetical protein